MAHDLGGSPQPQRGKFGAAPYAITAESTGWLIAGASRVAAPRFIEAVRALPPYQNGTVRAWVAAVYSHSAARANDFAIQQQIAHHGSELDELLDRPEIRCVYVANHPRHHGETALAALRAGKDVLCEPPLALNLDEAVYLRNAAANRGRVLAVNYQHRLDPTIEVLRKMVAEDDFGTILGGYVRNCVLLPPALHTWRIESAWGGILFDRTLRTIDLVRFLLADEISSVQSTKGKALFESSEGNAVEDLHSFLTMQRSGAVIQAHDSYLLPHAPSRIDLYGATGSVTVMPWSETHASALSIYRHGERLQVNVPVAGQLVRTLNAFVETQRGVPNLLATAAEDIANLQTSLAVRKALDEAIAIQPTHARDDIR